MIGFNSQKTKSDIKNDNLFQLVQTDDLLKYGLIPELVGRFSVIGVLEELNKEQLFRILIEPKDAITKQYKALFNMDGVNIEFSQDVLDKITEQAIKKHVGARGLRAIFEELMLDLMFELPSRKEKEHVSDIMIDTNFIKDMKWIA